MSGEMIGTEPSPMSKRQRKWYDKGYADGILLAESKHAGESIQFRNTGWELRQLQSQLDHYRNRLRDEQGLTRELRRDLQFANDRIEQLIHNASSIPKEKK